MAENLDSLDGAGLAEKLIAEGIAALLDDKDFKKACIAEIATALGPIPLCGALSAGMYNAAQIGLNKTVSLLSDVAGARAYSAIGNVKFVRKLLLKLLHLREQCENKAELKQFLLEKLAQTNPAREQEAKAQSVEHLHMMLTQERFDRLDARGIEIMNAVWSSQDTLLQELRAQYNPILDDRKNVGRDARAQVREGALTQSLNYTAQIDAFDGRDAEIDTLRHFTSDLSRTTQNNRFRWFLLVADGGEGKSRLALEYINEMLDRGWHAGFLRQKELRKLDPDRWQPGAPTFLVIDYPASEPEAVPELVTNLARRARDFDYPVRLLMLERQAAGRWFEGLSKAGSDGASLASSEWRSPETLSPLAKDVLLDMMTARLDGQNIAPEDLWTSLCNVDNRTDDKDVPAPRALFAAATALFLAENPDQDVTREDVLAALLKRDRETFWHPTDNPSSNDCTAHENLLALSTATLGLDRDALEEELDTLPAKGYLPGFAMRDPLCLDEGRFRRMSGTAPQKFLASLEPDLLGQYFTLSLLKEMTPKKRCALLDSAYALGGTDISQFIARCFRDFPALYDALDGLRPCNMGNPKSISRYVSALADVSYRPKSGIRDQDLDRLWAGLNIVAEALSKDTDVQATWANAFLNLAVSLSQADRPEEELQCYDAVVKRFGDADTPALQEQVAKALVNKGVRLRTLERPEEEIQCYDAVVERFGDVGTPIVQERVASALIGKGIILLESRSYSAAQTQLERYFEVDPDARALNPAMVDVAKQLQEAIDEALKDSSTPETEA